MPEKRWTHPPSKMDSVFRRLIRHTRNAHSKGTAVLPLAEVDRLIRVIRRFDPTHPTLANVPWGWRVEPNVPHLYGHIANIPDSFSCKEELPESTWTTDKLLITPKFEGVSVVAYYKNGVLQRCITQGDGEQGWDVTNNVISRVPVVIHPAYSQNRKERFTGYIRCVATVHAEMFFKKHSKTNPLKETIRSLLTINTDVPKASSHLCIIPVNIYNAPYKQYVRVGSPGWEACTRDFTNSLKFNFVTGNRADYITEEYAAKLSRPYPYNGLVVRKYGDENNLQGIFTYKLKGETDAVYTTVKKIVWDTTGSGKLHPTIHCKQVNVGGKWPIGVCLTELCGGTHQLVVANRIGPGTVLAINRKPGGQLIIESVIQTSFSRYKPDVKCSYGCDPEFLEISGVHAYCRNPRCPATTREMFKSVLDVFAPDYFYTQTRKRVMKHFHNNVFEFWDYYKNIDNTGSAAGLIDGLQWIGKQRYCEFLHNMLHWELNFEQLIKLCGIECIGEFYAKLIVGKASTSKELTEWAKETPILPVDWKLSPKAAENWTRRHYLVKEVLNYFKLSTA